MMMMTKKCVILINFLNNVYHFGFCDLSTGRIQCVGNDDEEGNRVDH